PGDFVRIHGEDVDDLPKLPAKPHRRCVFELVYFSRPDSTVFHRSVDAVRRALGRELAREQPAPGADCVFSVPDSSNAMALEESGTENTQSAPGAGCSRASSRPSARRTASTERWNTVLSGREKYTSSNTQRRCGLAGSLGRSSTSSPWMRTKSPGSSSRTSFAPAISSAHVSDATTQPRPSRPSTRGRKPRGSTIAYSVRPMVITRE